MEEINSQKCKYGSSKAPRLPDSEDPVFEETKKAKVPKDFLCGVGKYRPNVLQRFAGIKTFTVVYALFRLFHLGRLSYSHAIMSTVQRRFDITNTLMSVTLVLDNVASVFGNIFMGYFARKISSPILFFLAILVILADCFLSTLPYFIFGPTSNAPSPVRLVGSSSSKNHQLCPTSDARECQADDSWFMTSETRLVLILLYTSRFIAGLSYSVQGIVLPTYLDDGTKKKNLPLYLALSRILDTFGPAFGYLIASWSLTYYEDISLNPGFSNRDPRWIGAWWMGYFIFAGGVLLVAMPILMFPRYLSVGTVSVQMKKAIDKKEHTTIKARIVRNAKETWNTCKRLYKNPVYRTKIFFRIFYSSGAHGAGIMQTRYVEFMFRTSASKASLLTGPINTITRIAGTLLEGLVLRKCKPRAMLIAGYSVFINFTRLMGLVVMIFLTCKGISLLGTSIQNGKLLLHNSCNEGCGCSTEFYQPLCALDKSSVYFSPCFAGCSTVTKVENTTTFSNCTCMMDAISGEFTESGGTDGFCGDTCKNLLPFVILLTINALLSRTSTIGDKLIDLRCVDPEDRVPALAFRGALLNLIVYIPTPIVFGYIFDSACILWKDKCGSRGSCWIYDHDTLRYRFFGTAVGYCTIGLAFEIIMTFYTRSLKNIYGDETEEQISKPEHEKSLLESSHPTTQM